MQGDRNRRWTQMTAGGGISKLKFESVYVLFRMHSQAGAWERGERLTYYCGFSYQSGFHFSFVTKGKTETKRKVPFGINSLIRAARGE